LEITRKISEEQSNEQSPEIDKSREESTSYVNEKEEQIPKTESDYAGDQKPRGYVEDEKIDVMVSQGAYEEKDKQNNPDQNEDAVRGILVTETQVDDDLYEATDGTKNETFEFVNGIVHFENQPNSRGSIRSQEEFYIPTPANLASRTYRFNEIVPPNKDQQLIGWHGKISRDDSARLLKFQTQGTFLIRWSERANSYVLSYKDRSAPGELENVGFIYPHEGNVLVRRDDETVTPFDSLLTYVKYMQGKGLISEPIETNQYATSN